LKKVLKIGLANARLASPFSRIAGLFACALLLPLALHAQDDRQVSSPNGQVEFRIFIAQPNDGGLSQLAYQVLYHGKLALDVSWMGLDIHMQEPLLGNNLGLTHSSTASTALYHSLTLEYIQNGTVGRRINVEIRAYDDGVAFRYMVPRVTPLYEIPIHEEGTGFSFVQADALAKTEVNTPFDLPFVANEPGIGPVAVTEIGLPGFPPMHLVHAGGTDLMSRLAHTGPDPLIAYDGKTPLTCPWRLIIFGYDKDHLKQSETYRDLSH
jgi:alpha-glucosidase